MKVARKTVRMDEKQVQRLWIMYSFRPEGTLQVINGKARLVSEIYCDGLGVCLGECPQRTITIHERVVEEFDEEVVKTRLEGKKESPTIFHVAPTLSALGQWRQYHFI
jgi:Pyruvate/2-oxoacid:ferredoxin oxidoreductase delta subunit